MKTQTHGMAMWRQRLGRWLQTKGPREGLEKSRRTLHRLQRETALLMPISDLWAPRTVEKWMKFPLFLKTPSAGHLLRWSYGIRWNTHRYARHDALQEAPTHCRSWSSRNRETKPWKQMTGKCQGPQVLEPGSLFLKLSDTPGFFLIVLRHLPKSRNVI